MSAAADIAMPAAPAPDARPPAPLRSAEPEPPLARRLAAHFSDDWGPRLAWTVSRTGRPGLVGIALLLGAALFLFSTHLSVVGEVEALRADLGSAQGQARTASRERLADGATTKRALPARNETPAILRQLFNKAAQARLSIDIGKYEINASAGSAVVRYQIAFPVTGPYAQIRAFIDTTLATMPAVALSDLALDRKSIADGSVEAQIGMTVYTLTGGPSGQQRVGSATTTPEDQPRADADAAAARAPAKARAAEPTTASGRVVAPTHAAALFAQHSWFVLTPTPPPAPPPPPPEPTAPPFPYTFIGSFAPEGQPPVYFLSHSDRVIDAHVGDRLGGVYQFESAAGGQLVFVYLPLNIRQTVAAGAPK